MKIKYLRLNKKERKNIKKEFNKTNKGINVNKRIKTVYISALLLLIIGIYLLYESVSKNNNLELIYSIILIILSFIFIFLCIKTKIKKLNEYVINK